VDGEAHHQTVRAVDRALDILLSLSRAEEGLNLSDIAKQVQLHKSTVHRLLASLQLKGFVRKHANHDVYVLGWSVLELIGNLHHSDELTTVALPQMVELRDITGETVSLYIRSGIDRIRVQAVESNEPVRNVAHVGKTYPLFIGASGKVLLAFAEESLLNDVLRDIRIPPFFDRGELLQQLSTIRQDGFAMSIQERDVGTASIAAPVFGRMPDTFAALSVAGPIERFTECRMLAKIDLLQKAASVITKLLAH